MGSAAGSHRGAAEGSMALSAGKTRGGARTRRRRGGCLGGRGRRWGCQGLRARRSGPRRPRRGPVSPRQYREVSAAPHNAAAVRGKMHAGNLRVDVEGKRLADAGFDAAWGGGVDQRPGHFGARICMSIEFAGKWIHSRADRLSRQSDVVISEVVRVQTVLFRPEGGQRNNYVNVSPSVGLRNRVFTHSEQHIRYQ